jgi:hypothetical protein
MDKRIRNFDDSSLYADFEMLVKKILERNGFKVQKMLKNEGYDFSAIIENTVTYVEVKLYKSKLPKLDLLRQAYRRLAQKDDEYTKLVLVISSYVTPSLKAEILEESGVVVWDAKTLFALAFDLSTLYYELESILTRAFNEQLDDLIFIDDNFKSEIISSLKSSLTPTKKQKQIDNEGEKLCEELKALPPGEEDATNYERKCTEILKYLFDNNTDLTLWEEQPTTEDGLHRFDLLCRIISSHHNTFWTELAHDFHTRYVLFEFKNYKEKIKQGQIYTTEKYLFLTALRSVSFIITRKGADANAIKAAKGALKEAGKLIIILTNEDICGMLKMKSEGDEPAIILREKIDEMLRTLTR